MRDIVWLRVNFHSVTSACLVDYVVLREYILISFIKIFIDSVFISPNFLHFYHWINKLTSNTIWYFFYLRSDYLWASCTVDVYSIQCVTLTGGGWTQFITLCPCLPLATWELRGGSVIRACSPCAEALSVLQQPRLLVWPVVVSSPLPLTLFPVISSAVLSEKPRKAKQTKKINRDSSLHISPQIIDQVNDRHHILTR